jgi:hypothetical protein
MRRLLNSPLVEHALRAAALVVTDRRWAAPLSAAALGFGIFAGVAIGPGTAGSLATGARQIIELPSSGGGERQSGGGGEVASTESVAPALGGAGGGGSGGAIPSSAPLVSEPVAPLSAPAGQPATKPKPVAGEGEEEEKPEGQRFEGIVVHASAAAGSYAIAIKGGELLAVHAADLPEPGTKLIATLRRLANGTFAEADDPEQEKKVANEVSFRGVVTFANPDPAAPTYTVSGRGSSLPIEVAPNPSGAAPELPAVGSYVMVTTTIEESATTSTTAASATPAPKVAAVLVQSKVEAEPGPPTTYLDLAGVVREVTPEGLLFSADWTGGGESSLSLAVPQEIDASKLEAGESYLASAEVAADGSGALTLKGITGDERAKGADDPASAQGDLER